MEQTINWVEPELKWVEFGADEYVAGCNATVDITSCALCAGSIAGNYYVDIDGDGLSVADVKNNQGYHREYRNSCVDTNNPFTAVKSFFSVFIGNQLLNGHKDNVNGTLVDDAMGFNQLIKDLDDDVILYQNGSWAEGSVRDWVDKHDYWSSQFKEGYTYSSDVAAFSPFTTSDMTLGLSNHS